jgi:hypothetical protein
MENSALIMQYILIYKFGAIIIIKTGSLLKMQKVNRAAILVDYLLDSRANAARWLLLSLGKWVAIKQHSY